MSQPPNFRDVIRQLRIELQIVNDKVAAAAGLNPRDLDVLDVIDREGPCTPSHLADRVGHRRATITGILARLEQDHWITREDNPEDGRSARVSSTARFDELRDLYEPITDAVETLHEQLAPHDREALHRVLTAMTESVRERKTAIGR